MSQRTFGRLAIVSEHAFDPFIVEQSRAVDILVQHPCRQVFRCFEVNHSAIPSLDWKAGVPARYRSHSHCERKQTRLHDNAGRADRRIGLPERGNHAFAAALGRAEVDEQHLVFVVLDDLRERVAATSQVNRGELALEDRVLQMVAEVAHGFVDLAEALVIADVVADEESVAHSLFSQDEQRPCGGSRRWFGEAANLRCPS